MEAEAEEEKKSSCSAKKDQPPAPREPVGFGSFEGNAQEKDCKQEKETEGRTGDVVGRPWVAPFREEREKVVDAAAATWRSKAQANVEGLFSGADGAGVHGEGLAWGIWPCGEARPRSQGGRVESARPTRGQKDRHLRATPQMVVRGLQVDALAASQKEARCGRSFGRIAHRWRATTEQVRTQRQVTMVATMAKFWVMSRVIRRRGQAAEDDSQEGDSQEGRQGSRDPGVVRRAMHVGQVFRNTVFVVQREHDRVDRATELQKRSTMVSVAAQFFWAAKQDSAGDKKDWEEDGLASLRVEEDKETKKRRKKQRKQAELRLKAKWRTVVKAAGQAAQPMERARAMVQARQRRAEQGQLLLQAVDRGAEVVRLRRVLARALYSWGLGHAQDRAR